MKPVRTATAASCFRFRLSASESRLAGAALAAITVLVVLAGLQIPSVFESIPDWLVVLRNVSGWVGPVAVAGAAAAAAAAAAAGGGGGLAAASGAAGAAAAARAPGGTTEDLLRRHAADQIPLDGIAPGSWADDYYNGGPHGFLGWLTRTDAHQGRGGDRGPEAGMGGGDPSAGNGEMTTGARPRDEAGNGRGEPTS